MSSTCSTMRWQPTTSQTFLSSATSGLVRKIFLIQHELRSCEVLKYYLILHHVYHVCERGWLSWFARKFPYPIVRK